MIRAGAAFTASPVFVFVVFFLIVILWIRNSFKVNRKSSARCRADTSFYEVARLTPYPSGFAPPPRNTQI